MIIVKRTFCYVLISNFIINRTVNVFFKGYKSDFKYFGNQGISFYAVNSCIIDSLFWGNIANNIVELFNVTSRLLSDNFIKIKALSKLI
jgi:hypothetical protein